MSKPDALLEQAQKFIHALVADGSLAPTSKITHHFRSPSTAHRYSTAYHIIAGTIPRARLEQHPIDRDGNVWFQRAWLKFATLESDPDGYVDAAIKSQAASLSKETWTGNWHQFVGRGLTLRWPTLEYAREGYPADSPQRLPNLASVPLSPHIHGMAVDISLPLHTLTDVWDAHIDRVAATFGLHRPYTLHHATPEPWHFEPLDS